SSIERRLVELGMREHDLDDANIDILPEQRGGKAVAQRVGRHALFFMPAASVASWTARLSCRVDIGSRELRSGKSQPWGSLAVRRLPSRHHNRSGSNNRGDSIAL